VTTAVSTPLPSTASKFTQNALTLLHKRYLWHGEKYQEDDNHFCNDCSVRTRKATKNPLAREYHEILDEFFDRISMGNQEYRDVMTDRKFLPNSPTMFNIGTGMGTLSACFKFDVGDSMESIMEVAHKSAMVQKFGGGVGYYVGNLRAKNSPIKTTHGKACGPVEVLRMYNQVAELITQGGKRRGAQMGILDVDHPDIKEFIHMKDDIPRWEALATRLEEEGDLDLAATLRKQSEAMQTFNISVAITDDFMERAGEDDDSPEWELLQEMAQSSWTSGDPGVYFVDRAEATNPTPWLGRLTGTNPCGEVCLLDNEPCNLGSINLGLMTTQEGFDKNELQRVVRIAIRYLDDVLDENEFPNPDITTASLATRKLGLGVMGWADALALLEVPYDSELAIILAEKTMEFINDVAVEETELLAKEKGAYAAWADRPEAYQDAPERRNATVTCIAPTGSISLLANASGGIEPHFAHKWTREMGDGTMFQEEIPVIRQLEKRGSKFMPAIATKVSAVYHVKHLAAFQKYTELAVSKTINMAPDATVQDVSQAWFSMWSSGCKGGTIYRTGSREKEVLVADNGKKPKTSESVWDKLATIRDAIPSEEHAKLPANLAQSISSNGDGPLPSPRKTLHDTHESITHKFTVGGQKGWIHAGLYDDGTLGEVFLDIAKQGSTVSGLADVLAICVSLGLQHGIPVEEFVDKFRQTRFEPSGMTGNKEIHTATSLIDYLGHWLENQFVESPVKVASNNGMGCPDCGNGLAFQDGCESCTSCGWSRCG